MTFEERKKQVEKHRRLAARSLDQIEEHAFVKAKRALAEKHTLAVKKLMEECTHEETTRHSSYFSGSYYDKAYTDIWYVCDLCGAKSESKTEHHSWYG